ncbi:hypothetical protein PJF56_01385 [Roseofilum sp. BLCC_M91]|uniref:Rubredoxin-like domain-containing protein n=1 Tax=Roseofilum halophilum BLCC-M91 TaxID=3022259 RepID=A0ABT7BE91_9CYAN|nr:hypothetical protein [Roseofilum halophilum]MDJ1177507.1 hypothetical protein [Roseofilum halophilum BLCC-M91]
MNPPFESDRPQIDRWKRKIEVANQHNVFSHCHQCGYEWVGSSEDRPCPQCGSDRLERILCWQFPDG